MQLEVLRTKYKNKILEIAELCHAENIRVFGSTARMSNRDGSDIDFLVHMKPSAGLGLCSLQWRLEELLNTKVDVVPDTHIHPRIKDRILKEAVPL